MPLHLSRKDARALASVCTSVAETARRDLAGLPVGYEQVAIGLRQRAEQMERLAGMFKEHANSRPLSRDNVAPIRQQKS